MGSPLDAFKDAVARAQVPGIAPHQLAQPTPVAYATFHGPGTDGNGFVGFRVETATGSFVIFVTPDDADKMGDALKRSARLGRSGLSVPNGSLK